MLNNDSNSFKNEIAKVRSILTDNKNQTYKEVSETKSSQNITENNFPGLILSKILSNETDESSQKCSKLMKEKLSKMRLVKMDSQKSILDCKKLKIVSFTERNHYKTFSKTNSHIYNDQPLVSKLGFLSNCKESSCTDHKNMTYKVTIHKEYDTRKEDMYKSGSRTALKFKLIRTKKVATYLNSGLNMNSNLNFRKYEKSSKSYLFNSSLKPLIRDRLLNMIETRSTTKNTIDENLLPIIIDSRIMMMKTSKLSGFIRPLISVRKSFENNSYGTNNLPKSNYEPIQLLKDRKSKNLSLDKHKSKILL